ncbi:MAG: CoA-binding protein [Thaumarchaeota archaeon]|nr:CoA-binding protein [Nitrososphaerota archaeon]
MPLPSATISPREVLKKYRVIAVVGASKNPTKDAHTVPLYLKEHGYRVVPINPSADELFGEKAYPSLLDLPDALANEIEVVEVFRPSEDLPEVARQAVEVGKRRGRPLVFWAQKGLENEEAKETLSSNGALYVMNACMRVVHGTM